MRFETKYREASREWMDEKINAMPPLKRARAKLAWAVLFPLLFELARILLEAWLRSRRDREDGRPAGRFTLDQLIDEFGLTQEGRDFYDRVERQE